MRAAASGAVLLLLCGVACSEDEPSPAACPDGPGERVDPAGLDRVATAVDP